MRFREERPALQGTAQSKVTINTHAGAPDGAARGHRAGAVGGGPLESTVSTRAGPLKSPWRLRRRFGASARERATCGGGSAGAAASHRRSTRLDEGLEERLSLCGVVAKGADRRVREVRHGAARAQRDYVDLSRLCGMARHESGVFEPRGHASSPNMRLASASDSVVFAVSGFPERPARRRASQRCFLKTAYLKYFRWA
ncbi:hypothetical protein M885DRAFT_267696 [Pelagophyceae sp. CCMP2097]|nr:hypothetical protein M885DRAFT_267696 [Pelagophyceae sp. CCMP2097]